ncbi:hypothetical protein J6590_052688 [Homalodisca vitripennis]|nr:hypothetical protein J6590_052688 [Homalodisca vitripennis]
MTVAVLADSDCGVAAASQQVAGGSRMQGAHSSSRVPLIICSSSGSRGVGHFSAGTIVN